MFAKTAYFIILSKDMTQKTHAGSPSPPPFEDRLLGSRITRPENLSDTAATIIANIQNGTYRARWSPESGKRSGKTRRLKRKLPFLCLPSSTAPRAETMS